MELTKPQVQALTAARKVLNEIKEELEIKGNGTPFAAGKLAEASGKAEQAIFNVLNIANTFDYAEVSVPELLLEDGKE